MKNTWEGFKAWCYKYLGGLFMEEKGGQLVVSLGRLAILAVLVQMIWIWRKAVLGGDTSPPLPDGMLAVFSVLAGYVFGSKAVSIFQAKIEKPKEEKLEK